MVIITIKTTPAKEVCKCPVKRQAADDEPLAVMSAKSFKHPVSCL